MPEDSPPESPGLVHIYTGDGKGKTTAAIGLAVRAVGRGWRTAVIHFLKAQTTGEDIAAARLQPQLSAMSFGCDTMVDPSSPAPEDIAAAEDGLQHSQSIISDGEHDLVILDEICLAVAWNLLKLDDVIAMIETRPPGVEIVLTGREADRRLIELADYVTDMRCVKHPFDKGIEAREGIEH